MASFFGGGFVTARLPPMESDSLPAPDTCPRVSADGPFYLPPRLRTANDLSTEQHTVEGSAEPADTDASPWISALAASPQLLLFSNWPDTWGHYCSTSGTETSGARCFPPAIPDAATSGPAPCCWASCTGVAPGHMHAGTEADSSGKKKPPCCGT